MKTSTKIALASIAAITLPAMVFAGNSSFGGFSEMASRGMGMGGMSMHAPFLNGSGTVTVSSKIRETLSLSGVTLPSDSEITSAHAVMSKVKEARKSFQATDADKAALKSIRDSAQKAEREYLRSKGIALPSEDEIAKAQAVHESVRTAMDTLRPSTMGKRGSDRMFGE